MSRKPKIDTEPDDAFAAVLGDIDAMPLTLPDNHAQDTVAPVAVEPDDITDKDAEVARRMDEALDALLDATPEPVPSPADEALSNGGADIDAPPAQDVPLQHEAAPAAAQPQPVPNPAPKPAPKPAESMPMAPAAPLGATSLGAVAPPPVPIPVPTAPANGPAVVQGAVDGATLRDALLSLFAQRPDAYVLDLAHTTSLDASGVAVLLGFARLLDHDGQGKRLSLVNAPEHLASLFTTCRLDRDHAITLENV